MRYIFGTTVIAFMLLAACSREPQDPRVHGSASVRLKPAAASPAGPSVRRTVYVSVYSSIYLGAGIRHDMVDLSATVSVRNVSSRYPLILNYVRYYDSAGKQVREYVSRPSELAPLSSVEFVIQQEDTAGGPGASFLVQWTGPADIDEPVVEAVMVGRSGDAGVSFTTAGHVVKNEP